MARLRFLFYEEFAKAARVIRLIQLNLASYPVNISMTYLVVKRQSCPMKKVSVVFIKLCVLPSETYRLPFQIYNIG